MSTKLMFWKKSSKLPYTQYIPKELSMLHNLGLFLASEESKKEKNKEN